jgi:hypothetical protein
VIPSGLVAILLPVPEYATVTKMDNSGAHITAHQLLSAADTLVVQVIPSGLVITLSFVPELATATNRDNSGDHVIEFQLLSTADT